MTDPIGGSNEAQLGVVRVDQEALAGEGLSTVYTLHRHRDVSNVSGIGPVATICEFSSGLVAMHWNTDTPSVAVYTDIRHIEALHGHEGASTLTLQEDPTRLLAAYQRVVPWLLDKGAVAKPMLIAPHPDHPDRLRLVFPNEGNWSFWIDLLGGSFDAATHEEVNGEMQHSWISPDGNLWLQYFSVKNDYPDHDAYDPRD